MTRDRAIRWVAKPIVWALCLAPLPWLAWLALTDGLGANPIEYVNRYLGDWALRFLLIALAVTPLRGITGLNDLLRFRRLLGLFAFFYVCLHLSSYIGLDQFFHWGEIWKDIVKRTYITVGMASFLLLVPLAATSTKGMIKRLGGRNWNRLHKGIYVAAAAACLHFFMMRKGIQTEPIVYAGICAALLGYRAVAFFRKRAKRAKTGVQAAR